MMMYSDNHATMYISNNFACMRGLSILKLIVISFGIWY